MIRTRLLLTDISRWGEVGRAHEMFFAGTGTASSMVQVSALIDPALLVEVEADAVVPWLLQPLREHGRGGNART